MTSRGGGLWRFFDFVSVRDSGNVNEIRVWSTSEGPALKARLNALIRHLGTLDRALARPDSVGLLRKPGPCYGQGFVELIITIGRVQYRPIGWYGPERRQITLLVGAREKGSDFDPRNACAQAVNRKNLVLSSGRYIVDHDFR
jgi:hypothetical protein